MMRVLFLFLAYPDVNRKNTSLYTDLVAEFKRNGHQVYVVAPAIENSSDLIHTEGEVSVLRVKTLQLLNVNFIFKGIANLLLPIRFKRAIKEHLAGIWFDIVITPTPPVTFGSLVKWIKRKYNSKHYLILRDIFPQNAKDLGIIKNSLLFWFFRRKERLLYHLADSIGCMSPRNIEYIQLHNPFIYKEKLHLLPNWETPTPYVTPTGTMKDKYKLKGKFVAIFGGNIGPAQELEFVLKLAERLLSNKHVVFYFIGNGTERPKLENIVKEKGLNNVIFNDYIPREDYNQLVKECEIGLICLNHKFTIPNIPSKSLSYFNAKVPILASIDKCTDYGEFLNQAKAGLWSFTGDIDQFEKNFYELYNNPEKRTMFGENGYFYLKTYLGSENAYRTIISNL